MDLERNLRHRLFSAPGLRQGAVRSWTNNNRSPWVSSAGRFKIEAKATNTQKQKSNAHDNLAKRSLPVMSSCVLESSQSSAGLRSWQILRKTVSPRFAAQRAKLLPLNQLSIKQRTVWALVRVIVPAAKTSKQGDWNQIPKLGSLMGTSLGGEWKCWGK